jgi:hypothetical protein
MKFYAIMLDCVSPSQCSKINEISNKYNFTNLGHISAGSTFFSCFELFNGSVPSNIINDGIGYLSFGDGDALTKHAHRTSLDLYLKKNKYNKDWKFLEKNDSSLFHILNNNKIKSIVHNNGWVGKYIKSKQVNLYYSEEDLKEYEYINFDYPPFLDSEYLNQWGGYREGRARANEFYDYERKYIKQLQERKDDFFYYVDENIYHDINSSEYLSNFLDMWDFNEPDSVFFIFTDHYNTISRLFPSELWSVWGMIKDNRINKPKIDTKIFSSCDLYKTVLDFFNINYKTNYPIISKSIFTPFDKERIYYKEDSRLAVCCFGTDTFNTLKIIEWNNDIPKKLLKLTYLKGKTPDDEIDTDIEGIYQISILSNYNVNDRTWNTIKIYPCNLTNLTTSSIDVQIKLLANSLKERFNIKDLTNFNSYKNNYLNRVVTNGKNYWLLTPMYRRFLNLSFDNSKINKNNIITLSDEIIDSIPKYCNENINNKIINNRTCNSKYFKNYDINSEESLCLFNMYNNINTRQIHIIGDSHTAMFNGVNKI